jgi:putative peptide zinc metalloprotease protein
VFFDGGEDVKAGTVIATLANEDYLAQIKVIDAQIDEQRHIVADLKSRPKPEEIKVAELAVEVARTRERFSRDRVPRLEKLQKSGAVTLEELEAARKDHDTDVQQVQEKQAQLALVKTGIPPELVAAGESKLASLEQQRETVAIKLGRTTLRMPFDGNILTLHLKDRTNTYLDKGQPFAQVEYTGMVTAEVDLSEADAQYVRPNALVRLRPNAYFEREFVGRITTIDRNITLKPTGAVIKVIATIDNADGLLKTGMAGGGKVDGPTMPVWKAFGQAIIRFVRVQIWSWLP